MQLDLEIAAGSVHTSGFYRLPTLFYRRSYRIFCRPPAISCSRCGRLALACRALVELTRGRGLPLAQFDDWAFLAQCND